jgi:hypothetical protein
VWYATFLAGLGGSSSSLRVRSTTSEGRLLFERGAVDVSLEGSGGVLSETGVGAASLLMAVTRSR